MVKMCDSKSDGEMGFRDFVIFNEELLLKKCWRLLTNGNFFLVKVLKVYYFLECELFEV